MNLRRLRRHWDALGRTDPFWASLTWPGKKGRWSPEEFFTTGEEEIEEVMGHVRSLGVDLRFGRALDFGCGPGRLTQALADRFDDVSGVDIASSMIELAERYNRHPGRCRYRLNDRPDLLIFEDDTFDFIYSNLTLQHMEPRYQKGYLAELLRVLAPGGLLVFQLPSERIRPSDERTLTRRRKDWLKARAPGPLLSVYRRARLALASLAALASLGKGPRMEMRGMPEEEVVRFLLGHGGRMLCVTPDSKATDWRGFRYAVTKD